MPILALLLLLVTQDLDRVLTAHALPEDERIRLDGHLVETAWQNAIGTDAFLQQEPLEGAPPTERTLVRVLYNRDDLYIGVTCYDHNPDGILSFQKQRDATLATDDRFMWIIDTYNDGRSAYFFEINPGGLMGDGLLTSDQEITLNKDWDGIWDARVVRGEFGWSAEIIIPFRTLNFEKDRSVWGVNFHRTIRRRTEELVWSGHRRNQGLFRPQHAGRLEGLQGLSQGWGVEVVPYGTAQFQRNWSGAESKASPQSEAGFDVTYSLATNLRASVSVNTEFAEAEVDQRRVNLTRFPLRFPEQRDFFLEGSSVFRFAPASGVYPYFSRRIGLQEGQAIPITAAARLTGQVGQFDVGFLQIRTGSLGEIKPEDFTVARAKAHILSASTLGLIYTRRSTFRSEGTAVPDRHTVGADLELSFSSFLDNKNLNLQAFFIAHTTNSTNDASTFIDRTTRGVRMSFPNQPFFMHASYREFGSKYDPAVGFSPRNGFKRFQPSFGYSWLLSEHLLFRELILELRHEYLMDLDFHPETVNTSITQEIRFERGDELELMAGHDFERLDREFDIRRDGSVIVPIGDYHTFEGELEARSAPQKRISVSGSVRHGGFWNGTSSRFGLGMVVRPAPGISISGSWSLNDVNMEVGSFSTSLVRVATGVALTPFTALTANWQYDDLSRIAGLYARFRWTVRPGSNFYLVYTHNWQDSPLDRFRSLSRQTATKFTYTIRF